MAEGGSVMLPTKLSPFVNSICTPVLGLDSLNVQLREMVVLVLELTSRVDTATGAEAIERNLMTPCMKSSMNVKLYT